MSPALRHLRHRLLAPFTGERRAAALGRPFDLKHLATRPRSANEAAIRARLHAVPVGPDAVLARVLGRYKMYLDPQDVGISGNLLMDGYWEMWLTEAMARVVRSGMTVADIGANLGYYTLLAGDLVGQAGHVHAFEPNPALARRLRESVSINKAADRTSVHEVALFDHDRGARIAVPAREPKNGALLGRDDQRPGAIAVATARLDALAALAAVDVIKIDVEGAEQGVWRGMRGLLDQRRPLSIFLEFTAARYADPPGFLAEIMGRGFALSVIELSGRQVAITPERLLARSPHEDQTLLLERR